MGIFKRIKELENQNVAMSKAIVELTAKQKEIDAKLPEYEEAVAKGVGDQWNRAVQSVIDYNPFAKGDGGI